MKFSRFFLNRLQNQANPHDTVVVIDVLRSFTTAAIALDRGVEAIYPVANISTANILLRRIRNAITIGAVGGGDPIPGFDFGNSPSQLSNADLHGKVAILSTAAGVNGLQRFRQTQQIFASSLLCAKATALAIQASGAKEVCFVITGEWVDRDGDEDIACADYIEALLRDKRPNPATYAQRVMDSDFGQRFTAGTWPNLPLADLELAMQVDRFNFAMPVRLEGKHLVCRKQSTE